MPHAIYRSVTATDIEQALRDAPREERVALAARLIAQAWIDDDRSIDEPLPRINEDRDRLVAHLSEKIARR